MSMYRAIIGSAVAYVGQAASCDDTMLIQTETSKLPVNPHEIYRLTQETSDVDINPAEYVRLTQAKPLSRSKPPLSPFEKAVGEYLSATEPADGDTDLMIFGKSKVNVRSGAVVQFWDNLQRIVSKSPAVNELLSVMSRRGVESLRSPKNVEEWSKAANALHCSITKKLYELKKMENLSEFCQE